MKLDSNLVAKDGKGIFPRPDESEDQYVERAEMLLEHSDIVGDELSRNILTLLCEGRFTDVGLPSTDQKTLIYRNIHSFQQKYHTDFSWLPVFFGQGSRFIAGSMFRLKDKKIRIFVPPVICMNGRFVFGNNRDSTLQHELVHALRMPAELDVMESYERRAAAEVMADSAISGYKEAWLLHPWIARRIFLLRDKLRVIFGGLSDYVHIRLPYESMKVLGMRDVTLEKIKSHICEQAERGDLRFQILKHRTNL